MALFSRFTKLFRANLENPQIPLSAGLLSMGMGSITDSNQTVSPHSALEVPTFLACVRILSEGVGSLPLRVYEELERGRRVAKDHPLFYLLSQEMNAESTAITVMTTLMVHASAWQNAYAEIERDAYGRVKALWPRLPWRTKAKRDKGLLVYETTDTAGGVPRVIKAENMLHIPGFSLDGLTGSPIVEHARQSLGLAMVAAKFGARYYANGARPSFFLQPEAPLSPEDMTLLREDISLMTSGTNAWSVASLPQGIKVTPVTIDVAQSQYTETRTFERQEIAAVMRVPGYMVGATEKALKATIESQNMEFLTYSLRPWLERFEQELNRKLLPNVGRSSGKYSIHFWTDALLAVDKSTRTTCYTAGRNGGWLSINDIREAEGLEILPAGGDDYIQPLNMENVASAADGVETDDEVDIEPIDQSDPAARTKNILMPVLKDAIGRIQNRSNKDSATFTKTLTPVCTALAATLRTGDAGAEELKAVEKFISGAENRSKSWSDTAADDEYPKLYKSLVYAINRDAADAKSKKELQ